MLTAMILVVYMLQVVLLYNMLLQPKRLHAQILAQCRNANACLLSHHHGGNKNAVLVRTTRGLAGTGST